MSLSIFSPRPPSYTGQRHYWEVHNVVTRKGKPPRIHWRCTKCGKVQTTRTTTANCTGKQDAN